MAGLALAFAVKVTSIDVNVAEKNMIPTASMRRYPAPSAQVLDGFRVDNVKQAA